MKQKYSGIILIGHALLFAAAMLISAKVLAGTGHAQTISGLILVLWFATSPLLHGTYSSSKCEWAYIRRLFSSTGSAKKG